MARVLIVDDEPQILRALRINLLARQHEVVTAEDGTQALAAAGRQHPDLIVLDLGLPDLDGVGSSTASAPGPRSRSWCSPVAPTARQDRRTGRRRRRLRHQALQHRRTPRPHPRRDPPPPPPRSTSPCESATTTST